MQMGAVRTEQKLKVVAIIDDLGVGSAQLIRHLLRANGRAVHVF